MQVLRIGGLAKLDLKYGRLCSSWLESLERRNDVFFAKKFHHVLYRVRAPGELSSILNLFVKPIRPLAQSADKDELDA